MSIKLNSRGEPYPDVTIPGYGKIPNPNGAYVPNNSSTRPNEFTSQFKQHFKEWWIEVKGFPWPEGDLNIHHILPLKFGGTNSFDNLAPLPKNLHNLFTYWWSGFK